MALQLDQEELKLVTMSEHVKQAGASIGPGGIEISIEATLRPRLAMLQLDQEELKSGEHTGNQVLGYGFNWTRRN